MTMRRVLAMTGGAVVPMALLALIFGNQWVVDEINKSDFRYDEGIGPVVTWLLTLAWRITPMGSLDAKQVVAEDFGLLVFFGVLVGAVAAGARLADPERGPFGALIIGWWAAVVAGGVSGIMSAPLTRWAFEFHDGSFARTFSATVGQGASFGFAFGWLAGLGALGGFFLARTRESGPRSRQPYAPARPYLAPQGVPMQQPYPQQMQPHPSAVPYVPPQGQPQQPAWGSAPVPQPPQPGRFGVPPVPPQPSAPPPEQTAPEAPEEPEEAPGGRREQSPEGAPEGPEEPKEGSEDDPKDVPEDVPEDDASDDDDLDPADRTMVDRKRDDDA